MYYERWPVYESEIGRSVRLPEVVPQRATLRIMPRFYWHLIPAWVNDLPEHWTTFKEISIVPPEETWSEEVIAFIEESQTLVRQHLPIEEFAPICLDAMCNAIMGVWEPKQTHLVLHSAGWDSRLMSLAFLALLKEHGKDWLGDILFLECANEAELFKRVMEVEGWLPSQYVVYNEGAPVDEYHIQSLDFKSAWQRMDGGMRPYPFNMWWDTVEWAMERGLVSGNVQCWSGFTANWVARITTQSERKMGEELRNIPRNALSACPLHGEWIFPYADLDFMRTLFQFGEGQHPYKVIENVVCNLAPEQSKIENPVGVRYMALSKRLMRRAIDDYRNSWYGQLRPDVFGGCARDLATALDYNREWGHWGLASFCEKLRHEDYEIGLE